MPRNASGTYTLPSGNPVVSGTLIDATWANNTLSDLGNEVTDSLSRSGEGAMLAPLRITDGVQATPSLAFSNEPSSGLYRAGSNEWWAVAAGVQNLRFTNTGLTTRAAAGAVGTPSLAAFNDTDTGIYFPGANELAIATGGAARMTFDSAGAVAVPGTFTLSGGTANGVLYLNGSKVATSGSALVFDGTNLGVNCTATALTNYRGSEFAGTTATTGGFLRMRTSDSSINSLDFTDSNGRAIFTTTNHPIRFGTNDVERMRLTSSALSTDSSISVGIGTASPAVKVHVSATDATGLAGIRLQNTTATTGKTWQIASGNLGVLQLATIPGVADYLTMSDSGNLGLGVTPSAWSGVVPRALQFQYGCSIAAQSNAYNLHFLRNAYFDSGWKYLNSAPAVRFALNDDAGTGGFAWFISADPTPTAGNTISFTQAMTLTSGALLQVAYPGNTSFYAQLDASDGNGHVRAPVSGMDLVFDVSGSPRARITSGGNLLVATTDSAETTGPGLKLIGSTTIAKYRVVTNTATSGETTFVHYNTNATNNGYRFYVTAAGTINAITTTISAISDQRLKENVRDLDVGLDAVMALKPRKFDWKEGKGKDIKNDRGFIAQEFEQVFPDLIDEWKDPAPEGEEPYKSVRQDLIPVLVKAMQEQQAMIEELKAKVAALEAK